MFLSLSVALQTLFQCWWAQRKAHLTPSACNSLHAIQDAVGHLCFKGRFLAHGQFVVHQHSQATRTFLPSHFAAGGSPWSALMPGANHHQVHCFTKIPVVPYLQPRSHQHFPCFHSAACLHSTSPIFFFFFSSIYTHRSLSCFPLYSRSNPSWAFIFQISSLHDIMCLLYSLWEIWN